MQTYSAPLRDMRFALHELFDSNKTIELPGYEAFSPDLFDTILEEAAKFFTDTLLPINLSGDIEGCHYENGVVRTPKGFKEAYDAFCAGGWHGLSSDPAYGGQGLPMTVGKLVEEMICACNLSFGMYPGLTHGASIALKSFGSEALKDLYLPHFTDGSWSGTMCLTEPHCGTDLGLMRTKAVPQDDGTFLVTGNKIFISAGEHDLTENIIHLVLARLPDAPPGIKGISLFLVPKFIPDANGRPGTRNGVSCSGIEHKLGIKASATCQINLDEATGWIVGEPHKGMRSMFAMMNEARLGVAIQGLGVGEAAYQGAVAYAKERLQGRSLSGPKYPEKPADPIIVHPDVRRMLLTMRAYNEGCRALGTWVASIQDEVLRSIDPKVREAAEDFVAMMTPIMKAMFTDFGFESANLAVQIYGGHGYIREHGMEQYVRDARIAQIYEGTNGIQALDLVGRKLPANMGRSLRRFFHPVQEFIDANKDDAQIGEMVQGYAKAFGALQLATGHIAQKGMADPEEAGAAATEYLRLFGLVALGFMWLRATKVSLAALAAGSQETAFYEGKIATARFFFDRLLPQTGSLWFSIKSGKASMMALPADVF